MDRHEKLLDGCCRLCQAEALELLSKEDRYRDNLETAVCSECGLVQHAKLPTSEELSNFYTSEYRLAYNGEATPSPRRVYREWIRGRERFDALEAFVAPGDNVFEVGSGIGCNLKHFQNYGCQVRGIEPGEGFSSYSRELTGLDVRCAFLEDLESEANQDQSLVLLVHVLEHLPHPIDALQRIRQLLRPDGHLYIEVPNFGLPHAAPDRVFHYGHIYNFTEISLCNLAHRAGFRAQAVELTNGRSPNLAYILKPDPLAVQREIINGYELALSALHRYTPLSYRLRLSKLFEAMAKAGQRVDELLYAKKTVAEIRAMNRPNASASVEPEERKAA